MPSTRRQPVGWWWCGTRANALRLRQHAALITAQVMVFLAPERTSSATYDQDPSRLSASSVCPSRTSYIVSPRFRNFSCTFYEKLVRNQKLVCTIHNSSCVPFLFFRCSDSDKFSLILWLLATSHLVEIIALAFVFPCFPVFLHVFFTWKVAMHNELRTHH